MAYDEQIAWGFDGGRLQPIRLPSPCTEVLSGVPWGRADELFTPAFWKYQAELQIRLGAYRSFQLGDTLMEEVAACLLGGYGLPAELGIAAFVRLKKRGLISGCATAVAIERALSEPFMLCGGPRRYRFARQKSHYLSGVFEVIANTQTPCDPIDLRDFLLLQRGIGPKTASWIVRNHLASDDVAILDIHIVRAGRKMGLFGLDADVTRQYFKLERTFLEFCSAIGAPASRLDAIMWDYMRRLGPTKTRKRVNESDQLAFVV